MGSRMVRLLAGAAVLAGTCAGFAAPGGATAIGDDGCTPGYWKNHTDNWFEDPTDPISPTITLNDMFGVGGGVLAIDALNYNGGSGLDGATRILYRSAVAAWLNAAHEGLGYPLRRAEDIVPQVQAAIGSGDRQTILNLAAYFDGLNNSDCPLGRA